MLTDTQQSTSLLIQLQQVEFLREADSHPGGTDISCRVSESSGMFTGEHTGRPPHNVLPTFVTVAQCIFYICRVHPPTNAILLTF